MFFGGIFSRDIQGRNFFPDTFLRVGKRGILSADTFLEVRRRGFLFRDAFSRSV